MHMCMLPRLRAHELIIAIHVPTTTLRLRITDYATAQRVAKDGQIADKCIDHNILIWYVPYTRTHTAVLICNCMHASSSM